MPQQKPTVAIENALENAAPDARSLGPRLDLSAWAAPRISWTARS